MRGSSARFQRLFKEGFWIVFGQAVAMLGSLTGVRLLTEFLSPSQYGELALGMTVATLVNQVILGPLGQGVLRFYAPAVEHHELGPYLTSVRQLVMRSLGLIALLVAFSSLVLLAARQVYWIPLVAMALAFAAVNGCNSILSGMQNAARQRSVVALHQGLESWTRFLGAVAIINWLGSNSSVAMLGYALGGVFVLVSQWVYFRKVVPRSILPSQPRSYIWFTKIWQYSWPMATFGLFTWGQLISDRWALGLFGTTEDVGMYAVLFQLGFYPISIATGMSIQFLAPIFFQRAGDATDKTRNAHVQKLSLRLTGVALGLTGVIFAIALFLHKPIFQVFTSEKYLQVSYLFPWMVLAGGIMAAAQTISLVFLIQTKTKLIMRVKIATALLGIVLNLLGAYWHGTAGIVGASVIFSASYFFWILFLSKLSSAESY
jgi:O-antigen/teichoic acid export membrane protein